jgi:hypothetical protein
MALPFIFAILLLVIVVVVAYFSNKAHAQAWSELAARTGLACETGQYPWSSPRVTGNYRGHELTLSTFVRRHGKNSTTYTRIVMDVPNPTGLQLQISNEGILGKMGKALGAQDIQTSDQELDQKFIIKGQPEGVIASLLTSSSLRSRLMEIRSLNVRVDGTTLYFEKRGKELNLEYLQTLLDLFSELAQAIERAGRLAAPYSPFGDA